VFTGIVEHLGRVEASEPAEFGRVLRVDARGWGRAPAPGDSVAVNGCCLTVTPGDGGGGLRFEVVAQTLRVTTLGTLRPGDAVNLEAAATPATLLSGHLVQGHVDGVGVVRAAARAPRAPGVPADRCLRIEPPEGLLDCIVDRGSIAVDGVSLTVAALGPDWFEVALIPQTIARTTLGEADAGRRVNLEADCIVKAVVHYLRRAATPPSSPPR
jgi:riboflavin synthase alpha subunit